MKVLHLTLKQFSVENDTLTPTFKLKRYETNGRRWPKADGIFVGGMRMRRTKMLLTKCMLRPSWFAEGATASTAPRLSSTTPDSSRPPSSHSSQHLDYTLLFLCTQSALPCFDLLSRSPLCLHSPAVDRIARTAGALPLNADCGLDRCLSSTTPVPPLHGRWTANHLKPRRALS